MEQIRKVMHGIQIVQAKVDLIAKVLDTDEPIQTDTVSDLLTVICEISGQLAEHSNALDCYQINHRHLKLAA